MARFKIGQKLLLLLIVVSLVPLLIVGTLLVLNAQSELKNAAIDEQKVIATGAADQVDSFLASKTNILIFQSQTSAARDFDITNMSLNLAAMIKQDGDINKVALIDKQGIERVVVDRDGLVSEHKDVSKSDAFKATTFLAGKEYISPVTFVDGQPHVTIAVPLIRFTKQQDLTHLSTAEFGKYRSPDDILGVLTADFTLTNLWKSVLSTNIGSGGYAYVVDDKGNLIAHPDSQFLAAHQDVSKVHEVAEFLSNKNDIHTSASETGEAVLASHKAISRTNWGVIVEEPTSSVFAAVNSFYKIGGAVLFVVAVVAVICSLLFRKQILTPLKMIAASALRIGKGDFEYKIPVGANDEIGDLAKTFNSMGGNLQDLVEDLRSRNKSLGDERHKLSTILESVSDGVIAVNSSQKVLTINPPAADLVGQPPSMLLNTNLQDCFKLERNKRPFELDISSPGVFHYDNLTLLQDKKTHYLELVVVVNNDTNEIKAIITVHDLTQSKELEVMKLDFVAIAAHELRTPLTVVRGYLELMNNSSAIGNLSIMDLEYLQKALTGVGQLVDLINDILDVSHIERGTMDIKLSRVDVAELLDRAVQQAKDSLQLSRSKTIEYVSPTSKVDIVADQAAITEVVNNLISNAIKYTRENGKIEIKLEQTNDAVRVEVSDNGIGIPETSMNHLFTKFYRVESSMTTGNRGTGLGLYISKKIIELHHGKIGVVSKLGQGSKFYFSLPLYNEAKHSSIEVQKKVERGGIRGWFPKRTNS